MAILLITSGTLFAASTESRFSEIKKNTYIGVNAGYSISTPMNFQPDYDYNSKRAIWFAFEHAQFNSDMNTSPLYGAFIGYSFNPNISFDVAYDYRNQFKWDKVSDLYMPNNPNAELTAVGDRWRAKDIKIQTLLFGVNLKPCVNWGGVTPYVTGGIGAAWNRIGSFENNDIPFDHVIRETYDTHVKGKTTSNFAWKVGGGVNYAMPCYQRLLFTLGYQFVDVGTLKTGTHFYDSVQNFHDTINPFKANHVQLHEVFLAASYSLA